MMDVPFKTTMMTSKGLASIIYSGAIVIKINISNKTVNINIKQNNI